MNRGDIGNGVVGAGSEKIFRGTAIKSAICRSCIGDGYVGRINEPVSSFSPWRGSVDAAAYLNKIFPRSFDKPAVTRDTAAPGTDLAVKTGSAVGPDNDLAAIARGHGIGGNCRSPIHTGGGRIGDIGICALEITAHQHLAAAGRSRGINDRPGKKTDLVAQHLDHPALLARIFSRNIKGAGDTDDTGITAMKNNFPSPADFNRSCLNDAVHVDDPVDSAPGG